MKWLPVLALASACSDPGYICDQNRAHITFDGTCAVEPVPISIDGDFTDWAPLMTYPPDCPHCAVGFVSGVYATETPNGELAVYLKTMGAPDADAVHAYYAAFEPRARPLYQYGVRVTPSRIDVVMSYGIVLSGVAVKAASSDAGIELTIPISALPFTAGVDVVGELDFYDDVKGWQPEQKDNYPYATVCWDPQSPVCLPRRTP